MFSCSVITSPLINLTFLIVFSIKFFFSRFEKYFDGFSPSCSHCSRDLTSCPFSFFDLILSNSALLSSNSVEFAV